MSPILPRMAQAFHLAGYCLLLWLHRHDPHHGPAYALVVLGIVAEAVGHRRR